MNNYSIRSRILLLALLPVIALAAFLTYYNFEQARKIGDEAVRDFTHDMEESKRQEVTSHRP